MPERVAIHIRVPHAGDGVGLAQSWVDTGLYYANLNAELFQVPTTDGLVESLEAWALHSPSEDYFVRVAETDNAVVGAVSASFLTPTVDAAYQFVRELTQPRIRVDLLFVRPTYWRHGIGKRLLEAAEMWGRNNGAVLSVLETYVDSPVSIPFYERGMMYQRRGLWLRKLLS